MAPSWILIFSAFIAVAATAGATAFILRGYTDDVAQAKKDLTNLALALAGPTDEALQAIEALQKVIFERLNKSGILTGEDFRKVGANRTIYEILAAKAGELPQVNSLTIIDEAGIVIATSKRWPIPNDIYVADRAYFQSLSSDPQLQIYVSEPLVARITGKKAVIFARKITDINGGFIGVIVASIDLRHFDNICRNLVQAPTVSIGLYRCDGVFLAQLFNQGLSFSKNNTDRCSEITRQILDDGKSVSSFTSPMDRRERIVAVQSLDHYPVCVVVSEAAPNIFSGWRIESALIGVIALLMNLAIGIAGFMGLKQLRDSLVRVESESFLARHDVLTMLPNRLLFQEEMEQAISQMRKTKKQFAVLLLDLGGFKEINDTYGHPVGDLLLKAVAGRLQRTVRKVDFVARVGGDEFAVIHHDIENRQDTSELADRLIAEMYKPFEIAGKRLSISASIGAAMAPEHGLNLNDLLRAANIALYAAKSDPKDDFRFYDAKMNDQRLAQKAFEDDLRHAVDNNEFEVFYQPILELHTDQIWGFEALVRWKHPKKGYILPASFIPLAEETALIGPLGDWVLQEACSTAVKWPSPFKVAVNLSPAQFKTRDILASVKQALSESSLPPERLALEITETVLLDQTVNTTLREIKKLGVSISLDDFGTGYASLSYLRSFPFDKIKIDRSFVSEMLQAPDSRAIVRATLALARDLKMTTTAEGVETQAQLRALTEAGATQAQGYVISEPLPVDKVLPFVEAHNARRRGVSDTLGATTPLPLRKALG
ncbi:bifunctional diguanylate cyclase/phosphodiesterase [Microvirga sp. 2TAF3]|uniref:bifunctional diguanylate cyclase/phosphodiesterase n=1 Tax=Microvirga sp. 2TAF3 TaxID=3233014 RepID=UPI003F97703E